MALNRWDHDDDGNAVSFVIESPRGWSATPVGIRLRNGICALVVCAGCVIAENEDMGDQLEHREGESSGSGTCDAGCVDGTPLDHDAQIKGDCMVLVCDGAGGVRQEVDDTDVPCDGGECLVGVCQDGAPAYAPASAGTACDDGLFCTGADTCDADGVCVGSGDPCAAGDGDADCSEGCDEAAQSCTATEAVGTPCDDGLFCTSTDACNGSGACVGSGDPCSGPDGDSNCSESCNEAANACTANDPNGSDCGNCRRCSNGICLSECFAGEVCCPGFEICLPAPFC